MKSASPRPQGFQRDRLHELPAAGKLNCETFFCAREIFVELDSGDRRFAFCFSPKCLGRKFYHVRYEDCAHERFDRRRDVNQSQVVLPDPRTCAAKLHFFLTRKDQVSVFWPDREEQRASCHDYTELPMPC